MLCSTDYKHRENYSIEWYTELYVVIMLSVSVTVLVKLLAVTMDWTRPVVSLSQFGIEKIATLTASRIFQRDEFGGNHLKFKIVIRNEFQLK